MDCHRNQWPVFLVGCHRSGTTLLRYLLDAHENLTCPPESKFLAALQAFVDYPQVAPALESLGFSTVEIFGELRKLAEAFLGGYARREGKRRWVDKTPNYYRILEFIDNVFANNVLYLFITRHPLDCIDSLESVFGEASRYHDDPEIARNVERYGNGKYGWAKFWNEVNERLYTFSMLHPDRCYVTRYEDLVGDATGSMEQILAFLGEETAEGLVEAAFTQNHTAGYEDPKIRETSGIERGSIGKWKHWSSSEISGLWHVVGETASKFGYDEAGSCSAGT